MAKRRTGYGVALAGLIFLSAMGQASAIDDSLFDLPVDCKPGENCWIFRYMDVDGGKGARDYRCGDLSGEDHNGTDIAIANNRVMREGVKVLAAADGLVAGLRDGETDKIHDPSRDGSDSITGRECGNGVRIDHGEGVFTLYCHMRKGSIAVREGQRVQRGTVLGLIGLSGETNYPHLHFTVLAKGKSIDPFTGRAGRPGCVAGAGESLWTERARRALTYHPLQIFNLGFADRLPTKAAIFNGDYDGVSFSPRSEALVLWAQVAGGRKEDRVRFEIDGPDGSRFFLAEGNVPNTSVSQRLSQGRRLRGAALVPGTYTGRITLIRGELEVSRETAVTIR